LRVRADALVCWECVCLCLRVRVRVRVAPVRPRRSTAPSSRRLRQMRSIIHLLKNLDLFSSFFVFKHYSLSVFLSKTKGLRIAYRMLAGAADVLSAPQV
jgi:hypothetical protein